MYRNRMLPILVLAALPSTARAVDLCSTLGAAARFVTVVSSRMKTQRSTVESIQGTAFLGSVCMGRGRLDLAGVYDDGNGLGADLVATQASGTALRITGIGDDFGGVAYVDGDVATGGGAIRGTFDEVVGTTDTSGAHPVVATCAQAMADAETASATLAALPPTQVLGTIRIALGTGYTIDARGGAVVQIGSLVLEGQRRRRVAGPDLRTCDDGIDTTLDVLGDAGDTTVLTIAHLDVGNCGRIRPQRVGSGEWPRLLLNVPGAGRQVRVGFEARMYDGVDLLAPHRSLVVTGSSYDYGTLLNQIWVKRASFQGYSAARAYHTCP
jgi:hypothetical protein